MFGTFTAGYFCRMYIHLELKNKCAGINYMLVSVPIIYCVGLTYMLAFDLNWITGTASGKFICQRR